MKTLIYTLLACLASLSISYSQDTVPIDDTGFLNALIAHGVDTNSDGKIQVSEAIIVETLFLNEVTANNINGIEAFTSLKRLRFTNSNVTYPKITNLANLEYIGYYGNGDTIELRNLANLLTLEISPNNRSFDSVILENLQNLTTALLTGINTKTIDIPDLPNLRDIKITGGNFIEQITFGDLPSLRKLVISRFKPTAFDIAQFEHFSNLRELNLIQPQEEISMDISNYQSLKLLRLSRVKAITGNNENIDSIFVANDNGLSAINNDLGSKFLSVNASTQSPIDSTFKFPHQARLENLELTFSKTVDSVFLDDFLSLERVSIRLNSDTLRHIRLKNCPKLSDLQKSYNIQSFEFDNVDISSFSLFSGFPTETISLKKLPPLYLNLSDMDKLPTIYCGDSLIINSLQVSDMDIDSVVFQNAIPTINELILSRLTFESNQSPANELENILSRISGINDVRRLEMYECSNFYSLNIGDLNELFALKIEYSDSLKHLQLINGELRLFTINSNDNIETVCIAERNKEELINQLGDRINHITLNEDCPLTSFMDGYRVSGNVYFEIEKNNCTSNTHYPYAFPRMELAKKEGKILLTGAKSGYYNSFTDTTQGDITLTPSYDYGNIRDSTNQFSIQGASMDYMQDWCIEVGKYSDVGVLLSNDSQSRPGSASTYQLLVRNLGSVVLNELDIQVKFDEEILSFLDVGSGQEIGNGVVTWTIDSLLPYNEFKDSLSFRLNSPIDTPPLNLGDVIVLVASVKDVNDENRSNDNFTLYDVVVNSYDPNDKVCLNGSLVNFDFAHQDYYYKIRFENKGNADAIHVVIKDSIDLSTYNLASFKVIDASHPLQTEVNDSIVSFNFENIYLSHLPSANKGYVIYSIRPHDNITLSDSLVNKASIYFDYNLPIHTDDAITSFYMNVGNDQYTTDIESKRVTVSPNPSKRNIVLSTDKGATSLIIYDQMGQIVRRTPLDPSINQHTIDIGDLPPNLYLFNLVFDNETATCKVLKN